MTRAGWREKEESMLTRIRIEAAAQTTEDVSHDLWAAVYVIAEALVADGAPIDNPFIHEEVITRLDMDERTDAHLYKGRIVVGYPVDWDHAKGWFEIWAAKNGITGLATHGQLSVADRKRIQQDYYDKHGHDVPAAP